MELRLIKSTEIEILENLFQLYIHDISKSISWDINNLGKFEHYNLEDCFEKNTYPYFICEDKKIIGFIILNNNFIILDKEEKKYNISELFILNSYKRKGIAKTAVYSVLELFKGYFEVRPVYNSQEAKDFWVAVINDYTKDNYVVTNIKNDRIVITFNNMI